MKYSEWLKLDSTYNFMLQCIIKINRGDERTLDYMLKEEYVRYMKDLTWN